MKNLFLLILSLVFISCNQEATQQATVKKLGFAIEINSSPEKVYSTMIDKDHFKEWVAVFNPKCYFEGSWEQGEKMVYITPDENGVKQGMISRIKENLPNKKIFIQPIGIVENGLEILEGDKIKGLDQSYEIYNFYTKGDKTRVVVETAVYPEFEAYFNETWPKALEILKFICEAKK